MKNRKLILLLTLTTFVFYGMIFSESSLSIVPFAMAASKLGDLSKFKKITVDTKALLESGGLAHAKIRIKDLETSWDEAEAGLKPRAAADWHVIDKGIDRALSALRADSPDVASCKKAISELLGLFDQMESK